MDWKQWCPGLLAIIFLSWRYLLLGLVFVWNSIWNLGTSSVPVVFPSLSQFKNRFTTWNPVTLAAKQGSEISWKMWFAFFPSQYGLKQSFLPLLKNVCKVMWNSVSVRFKSVKNLGLYHCPNVVYKGQLYFLLSFASFYLLPPKVHGGKNLFCFILQYFSSPSILWNGFDFVRHQRQQGRFLNFFKSPGITSLCVQFSVPSS